MLPVVINIILRMDTLYMYRAGWCNDDVVCRSMLPDVIDESILTRGVRREELFYAFFVFGIKLSSGLALGVSTAVYKYVYRCIDVCSIAFKQSKGLGHVICNCLYSHKTCIIHSCHPPSSHPLFNWCYFVLMVE